MPLLISNEAGITWQDLTHPTPIKPNDERPAETYQGRKYIAEIILIFYNEKLCLRCRDKQQNGSNR